jgi:hypothetical protein
MVEPRTEGEQDKEMNYQMHVEPYLIERVNHHHEELLQEMEALSLEKRLRENRRGQASGLTALVRSTRYRIGQSLQGSPSPCRCR